MKSHSRTLERNQMSNDKPKFFYLNEITVKILSTFKSKHDENKKNILSLISMLRNINNITIILQCKYLWKKIRNYVFTKTFK